MTSNEIAEALKARITAHTKRPTLDLDEARDADELPAQYVEFHLARRAIDSPARSDGSAEANGWRLSTRACAKTIDDARLLEDNVRAAFQLNPIALDGKTVAVRYESGGGDFDSDDQGYFSALTDRIFVR